MPNHDAGGTLSVTFYAEDGLYDHLEIATYLGATLKKIDVPFEDGASVKDGSYTLTLNKQAANRPIWTLTASGSNVNFYRVIGIK